MEPQTAAGVQMPSLSPDPVLNQGIPQTAWIKEEPEETPELGIKTEDEQLPVCVPESSVVCVKTEDSSLLLQTHNVQMPHLKEDPEEPSVKQEEPLSVTESSPACVKTEESTLLQTRLKKEDAQGVDTNTEIQVHSNTEVETGHSSDTDDPEDWRAPTSCSDAGALDLSAHEAEHRHETQKTQPAERAQRKGNKCNICHNRFRSKYYLQIHIRVHTGEKPFCCSTCKKTFAQKSHLIVHTRTHTGERPYCCSVCEKTFVRKHQLTEHTRTHTGEKPYSCSVCAKRFATSCNMKNHVFCHTKQDRRV